MYKFVCDDGNGESDCSKLAKKVLKNEKHRRMFVDCIYGRAGEILEKFNQICDESNNQVCSDTQNQPN